MKLFLSILTLFLTNSMIGQIVINEYSAANLHEIVDNYGKTEDWIELYNTSNQAMDISGYHLSDKTSKPGKWEIPAGTSISPKGYLVFWCSGRDEIYQDNYHTNFKLSQTEGKDRILLTDPNEMILEDYEMVVTLVECSIARSEDNGSDWMVNTRPTPGENNSGGQYFERYTVIPTIDQNAGYYEGTQSITITNNEPNSVLRFSIDGKNVTNNSTEYTGPITISSTAVVKARSFSNDSAILPGKMDFSTFFIDEDFTVAVFSVAADQVQNLANGAGELIPIGSIEYFNKDKEREATSYGDLNRHGQDSWVLNHRSIDWASRDEMGYSKEVAAPLFSFSDRDGYQKFMFRNSGDDNYPAKDDFQHEGSTHIRDEYVQTLSQEGGMHLDTRAVERVVLFLNGEYWGLYGMRDRPVDHDYTDEYYNQGKYDLHYLTTWGSTKAQYGGQEAFDDWFDIRDFILNNDMSVSENYNIVEDRIDLISLSDYFIANQNVVAKDWLNYNTGWWRGLLEDEKHTKWGYILWDMDATFDYYINYTDIPNDQPDAEPCDIYDIATSMDNFFGIDEPGGGDINPDSCLTILNGTCPYPPDDSIFQLVINEDLFCCDNDWDPTCQNIYDNFLNNNGGGEDTCQSILNGSSPYSMDDEFFQQVIGFSPDCCDSEWDGNCQLFYDFLEEQANGNGTVEKSGNIGKHEKLLIKLLEENEEFKNLYFTRYADLMNTVYSCENMNATLERMLNVIIPEMPRQIERWGGTLEEWEMNVEKLKTFINARCELLDDGIMNCYEELSGPYEITLLTQPEGVGTIEFNTMRQSDLPWTGTYFGGMSNTIDADLNDDEDLLYKFSHWESMNGSTVFSDPLVDKLDVNFVASDSLLAVFDILNGVDEFELENIASVFPNPTTNSITISYELTKPSMVKIQLYDILGLYIADISSESTMQATGKKQIVFDLKEVSKSSGMYIIKLTIDDNVINKKVSLIE